MPRSALAFLPPSTRACLDGSGAWFTWARATVIDLAEALEAVVPDAGIHARFYAACGQPWWSPARAERYRRLAEVAALVAVWSPPDVSFPTATDRLKAVGIGPGDPLAGAWVVVLNAPGFAAALLAEEVQGNLDGRLRGRLSLDREAVSEVEACLRERLGLGQVPTSTRASAEEQGRRVIGRLLDEIGPRLDRAHTREGVFERESQQVRRLLSHDLKSPLGFITGMAELMLMGQYGALPPRVGRMLAEMIRQGERVAQTLDQVVLTYRLESGEVTLRRVPADVRALLESAARELEADVAERGCRVVVQAPAGLRVRIDRRQIGRVVGNLVAILLEQGASGGDLVLGAGRRRGGVEIDLRYRHPDVSPEAVERLARALHDDHPDPLSATTALRLRFCKLIAKAHGGSVVVEDPIGGGVTFRVRLPAR